MTTAPGVTLAFWYDPTVHGGAEAAARFYAATFPASSLGQVHRAPGDFPGGKLGDAFSVEFTALGFPCLGFNGGPYFQHSEAFSFQLATDTQAETDRYWHALTADGGTESQCGWCKDKWGISWQITPRALARGLSDPDPGVRSRAHAAMMKMKKIDIATIEAARHD